MRKKSALKQPTKAFAYCRVSTQEQAEHKISLETQKADIIQYASERGIEVIEVFQDPGISGTDWQRPEFNRMIAMACSEGSQIDAIIACDMARIARDLEFMVGIEGKLKRAGIRLLYVYQNFADNHGGTLHRILTAWQDQDAVVKAAMNTRRGLRGTAKDGFFVGGKIPFGYESRTVEIQSKKHRKKLFVCEEEAAIVRLIFQLAEKGLDTGPMGARAIAEHLNNCGHSLRGKPFWNSSIAGILGRMHYLGRFIGNRFGIHGEELLEQDWTWVECPQIISREQFERVAALREVRAPRSTPPRIVNGPTILTGIAMCGMPGCGHGMTIATGKGGMYKYYKCHAKTNRGASACSCPNVRAEKLDAAVMAALADRILAPDKLEPLLKRLLDTSSQARQQRTQELQVCEDSLAEARKKLSRLHDGIESGTISPRDPDIAARLKARQMEIESLNSTAKALRKQLSQGRGRITAESVRRFGEAVRAQLLDGDDKARQQIARAFIREVRIGGDQITVMGNTSDLEHAATLGEGPQGLVPSFNRNWCGREDSNFHGLSATTTSTLRVYQFRHDRTSQ